MRKSLLIFTVLCLNFSAFSQKNFTVKDSVPNFKLWLINGNKLTKKDIKNKVVVFKFWFTSCMPCLVDIPKLNSLKKEFSKRNDILFVAPALDRKPVIEKLLKVHPFNFKIAYSAMDVSRIFNKNQVYPSFFVVDKKGQFVYIDSSSKKSSFNDLRNAVITALKI